MIRKLLIEIETDVVTCGACRRMKKNGWCKVFNMQLVKDVCTLPYRDQDWMRCKQCAEAEVQ